MSVLTLKERLRIAALSADRSKRSAIAGMLSSPFLRWSFGPPAADQLLLVPQDLRTADPSFWHEIEHGQFGLAGSIAFLRGCSPFDIDPPNDGWVRELHGFGWLRNLAATGKDEAREVARRLTAEWALRRCADDRIAAEPAVAARRLISWISHANVLLEGADQQTYRTITQSLGRQLVYLSAAWGDAPEGYPRLLALIALTLADLSIAGHERQLKGAEVSLAAELAHQILPDGGHISRNPSVLVEIMLDLLPLSQCFSARARTTPAPVSDAVQRIMPMLRLMRLGDGLLGRFNGMGVPSAVGLATVLAYDDNPIRELTAARDSGYVRLKREKNVVLIDTGCPPPLAVAGEAQAGCLSFEMSVGAQLLFVNGGIPGAAAADWRPSARATASHNTLCLAETSSSKLVRHPRLEELIGAPPIQLPAHVQWSIEDAGGAISITASHDGYLDRFELIHSRRLCLAFDGARLEGWDRLAASRGELRLRSDLPFAIHFHLHPEVKCRLSKQQNEVELKLADGQNWRFRARGAALTVEESAYFADSSGPRRALQIVLRGVTFGESEVSWVVGRAD
ncbi:MAG: heparinase II/III family protein [Hyphomicrobium sp.]